MARAARPARTFPLERRRRPSRRLAAAAARRGAVLVASSASWYAARAARRHRLPSRLRLRPRRDPARRKDPRSGLPAIRRRGRASLPRPTRGPLHRRAHRRRGARLRGAVLPHAAGRPLHGGVPPACDRPRDRGPRTAPGGVDHEPSPVAPAVSGLATRALRDHRGVAARHAPRHPQRQRPRPDVAAVAVCGRGRLRRGRGDAALRALRTEPLGTARAWSSPESRFSRSWVSRTFPSPHRNRRARPGPRPRCRRSTQRSRGRSRAPALRS